MMDDRRCEWCGGPLEAIRESMRFACFPPEDESALAEAAAWLIGVFGEPVDLGDDED